MNTNVTDEVVTEVPVEGLSEATPAATSETAEADWRSSLPEELKNNATLETYTSVESLAKAYLNASSMLGKDKLFKPNSEDEWKAFYDEMGRPTEPAGYEFPANDADSKFEVDAEMVDKFRSVAHEAGLSGNQAQRLYEWYTANNAEQYEQAVSTAEESVAESEASMRKEWGKAYDHKMEQALRAVREFGGEPLVDELNATGLGNNPNLIKAFASAGERIIGDQQLEGDGSNVMTPAQIKDEIAAIQNDPSFYDSNNLERPSMVRKMQGLMEELHGTEPVGGYSVG
tara:strand:- start:1188 stop:2045 length:858 start_codon:yes stop_codon:yes gene_type:complete